MAKKREMVGVFGLHEFGKSIAEELAKQGCQVLAVDIDMDRVEEVSEIVTMPRQADVTDEETMKSLELESLDMAVVAITGNVEASIIATMLLKNAGVKFVLAKAKTDLQAKVLDKVGADRIVFPERDMGIRTARSMANHNFDDVIELGNKFSIAEAKVPASWGGKSLRELNLRGRYGLNVIAGKKDNEIEMTLDPDRKLTAGDTLIIAGTNKALEEIR